MRLVELGSNKNPHKIPEERLEACAKALEGVAESVRNGRIKQLVLVADCVLDPQSEMINEHEVISMIPCTEGVHPATIIGLMEAREGAHYQASQ